MKKSFRKIAVILVTMMTPMFLVAQKGTGDLEGVAQQTVKPEVVTLTGKLLKVNTGPCENTQGRSPAGTHLIVKTSGGTVLNVHLGPENAVDHVVDQLRVDDALTLNVFRTDRLPENAYIAKSLVMGDKVVHLRDRNLRPSWAYNRGKKGKKNKGKVRDRWGNCW